MSLKRTRQDSDGNANEHGTPIPRCSPDDLLQQSVAASTSTHVYLANLPKEMIGEIASWLPNARDAAAFSQVARIFNEEMERHMYKRIALSMVDLKDISWALLLRTFSSRPDLAAKVERLEFTIGHCGEQICVGGCETAYTPADGFILSMTSSNHQRPAFKFHPAGYSTCVSFQELHSRYAGQYCPPAQVLTFANLTPNLRHLNVAICDEDDWGSESKDPIGSIMLPLQASLYPIRPNLPALETLSITGSHCDYAAPPYDHDLNDLDFFWNMPSLRIFHVEGCGEVSLSVDIFRPQTASITKLVLKQTLVDSDQLSTLPPRRWRDIINILQPAKDTLEYLSLEWSFEDLEDEEKVEQIAYRVWPVLSFTHFSTLTHLKVPLRALFAQEPEDDEEFDEEYYDDIDSMAPYPIRAASIEDILPTSLSILELDAKDSDDRTYDTVSESFERLRLCAHDKLPNLTKVAAVGDDPCPIEPTDREQELARSFKDMGLELDWNDSSCVDWRRYDHLFWD
ncbi:hypothetical protein BU16DRAFT_43361 [Lophium mytilinum]|uniref:F-box domain-containing protein n=1 Tax=Lophium mytilinum TaxID=390894 RepID=A0A6A6QUI2_9PEZI|nr:hypothetical protein BU16DRAFT_43361 [Lophium mytilinum]